jgi:hypothetical protein
MMRAVAPPLSPRASSPFRDGLSDPSANFCGPAFRAGIEFLGFTKDGFLRRPAFRRFSDEIVNKI